MSDSHATNTQTINTTQAVPSRALVGGNLSIESVQDTATYREKSDSAGFSLSVPVMGAGTVGGSVSGSLTQINSDYASVREQSGIRAEDAGFQVGVAGNTNLKGGAITSTQSAIDNRQNVFATGGKLTTSDIQNKADYEGSGGSLSLGVASTGEVKSVSPGGAGYGELSGSASSMTLATISGIAGSTAARTGDRETGIAPIFDAERVRQEINAQVQITQEFDKLASKAVGDYVLSERTALRDQLKHATTAEDKAAIQKQLDSLLMQERVMNILIGGVTGMGTSVLTKEGLSAAADKMRTLMREDSMKFAGITDGKTVLSNMSGKSDGLRLDFWKSGGTRTDLDILCGTSNERCKTKNGQLLLDAQGMVQFDPKEAKMSLEAFLSSEQGKKLVGLTGGIQGWKGTLFGIPYPPGSWQDKLIEAFGGTHDFIGGKLSGLYDEQGNIKRGMTKAERSFYDKVVTTAAIIPSTPFAMAELLPPEMWQAIAVLLKGAR